MRTAWDKILTNLVISQMLVTAGLVLLETGPPDPSTVYADGGCKWCGGIPMPGCNPETGGSMPGDWVCCGGTWIDLDYQCCCDNTVMYCPEN
jgi:hypothetical protein